MKEIRPVSFLLRKQSSVVASVLRSFTSFPFWRKVRNITLFPGVLWVFLSCCILSTVFASGIEELGCVFNPVSVLSTVRLSISGSIFFALRNLNSSENLILFSMLLV